MSAGIVRLTEQQASALIHDDLDGAGPCLLGADLMISDLAATSVVPNARIMMAELDGAGAKLTAKGNLNRKLLESLVARFQWQGYPAERIWEMNKVINESDYPPALYLHAVLKLGGLVRTEKGFFKLNPEGQGAAVRGCRREASGGIAALDLHPLQLGLPRRLSDEGNLFLADFLDFLSDRAVRGRLATGR